MKGVRLFCAVLMITICSASDAQTSKVGFSVNPKMGAYDWLGDNIGVALGGEFNVLYKKLIVSADYYHTFQVMNDESFNEVDLLIGRYIGENKFRFQIEGGLGALWGINETGYSTDYRKEDIFAIGIPVKLGFKYMPARFISLGIDFQAHINGKKPIYMTFGSIEVGILKP